ncbi:hypothetical protein BDV41DRAFT_530433 [Aspergillus transmontanensis]|uniref:Uncharacterized protein n=1 Tax=Aspergillus transmontanensis TaxID=1034304 RepID=A0A5N6W515_9EURO|nr:hypothetical protein BDV41DRAFT_530433 [Aspergillus transmontanensis]
MVRDSQPGDHDDTESSRSNSVLFPTFCILPIQSWLIYTVFKNLITAQSTIMRASYLKGLGCLSVPRGRFISLENVAENILY